MIELRKWEVAALALAPFILMASGVMGAWGWSVWRPLPAPDPRAVDEIRIQMGKLREKMILDTIQRVDVTDCKSRRWEMSAEFVPFAVVIGEQCGQKKKRKGKG